MDTTSFQNQLKEAKTTITITPDPLVMEKVGDTFRGLYLGIRPFEKLDQTSGELKRMPVAHFWDGEKVVFNMGKQMTDSIQVLPPGTSVEVKLKELKKNAKGGSTKIYSITPLDIPRVDLRDMFGGHLEISAHAPEHLALPSPKPQRDLRAEWSLFCSTNGVAETHIQQALSTPRVSEWLAADTARSIEDAMALVLNVLKEEVHY
jgi:hypothetical protein